ncbi:7153_t:CDS:2 [Acaulospora morrowiae]|uniref:7153_t:CDS:1 n=1 Tax=Acaulospora morrowiae TaxID=94023 RepID=A0A9N9G1M9_9GLOM|nr:7153_t:CDS:2 [Acaulospora morrowiae]
MSPLITIARAQSPRWSPCLPLKGSKYCGAFSNYSISAAVVTDYNTGGRFDWVARTDNISNFDDLLMQYVKNDYINWEVMNCSNFNSSSIYARYTITMVCAELVEYAMSLQCNQNISYDQSQTDGITIPIPTPTILPNAPTSLPLRRLCNSTCQDHILSLQNLVNRTQTCNNTSIISLTDSVRNWCEQGDNISNDTTCISGDMNEENCELVDRVGTWAKF